MASHGPAGSSVYKLQKQIPGSLNSVRWGQEGDTGIRVPPAREDSAGQMCIKSAGVRTEGAVRPPGQAPAVVQLDAACP